MEDMDLIRHLKQVHSDSDTSNFNVLDFVSAIGNPLDALMYSKLFWPDFVEFEDMIFLKDQVEDEEDRSRITEALSKFADRRDVEKSFNRFLIPFSLFASSGSSITSDEEDVYLAEQLVEMWRSRLAQLFPNRKCEVHLLMPEETHEEATILVFQR